jgi:hypothetical protein
MWNKLGSQKKRLESGFAGILIAIVASLLIGSTYLLARGHTLEIPQELLTTTTPTEAIITPTTKPIPTHSPIKEPSSRALKDAALLFAAADASNRAELIKDYSQGTNSEATAINNLAIYLDANPDWLAKTESALQIYALRNQNSQTAKYVQPIQFTQPQQYVAPSQIPSIQLSYPSYSPTPPPQINVYGGADSYTRYGNTVYGNDGSSYTQYGNTVYGNDGSSYTQYGNTVYGNDGSSWSKYGNTTYGSNGTSYSQYGNTLYGSNGSSYTQYGNTLYGTP